MMTDAYARAGDSGHLCQVLPRTGRTHRRSCKPVGVGSILQSAVLPVAASVRPHHSADRPVNVLRQWLPGPWLAVHRRTPQTDQAAAGSAATVGEGWLFIHIIKQQEWSGTSCTEFHC